MVDYEAFDVYQEYLRKLAVIDNAKLIAKVSHEGQTRKWGPPDQKPAPYIQHPSMVADKVAKLKNTDYEDVAAAWLHDVIEDVAIPKDREADFKCWIRFMCGDIVLGLVEELTNPTHTKEWDGKPREEKNKVNWEHLAKVSDRAKRIKLVDRWANLQECQYAPKKWLAKYVKESRHLLSMIGYVDEEMAKELEAAINEVEKFL